MIKFKRVTYIIAIVFLCVVLLRGAIGFFHPKSGTLVSVIQFFSTPTTAEWVVFNISLPTYGFLVTSIWSGGVGFWGFLILAIFIAVFITEPTTLKKENA